MDSSILNNLGFDPVFIILGLVVLVAILAILVIVLIAKTSRLAKKYDRFMRGRDAESLEEIKKVYDLVIEVGTYPVSSIKTAEAVKVVENSQRDINIAFMNELAMVFDRMGIDTYEVVDGMNT